MIVRIFAAALLLALTGCMAAEEMADPAAIALDPAYAFCAQRGACCCR